MGTKNRQQTVEDKKALDKMTHVVYGVSIWQSVIAGTDEEAIHMVRSENKIPKTYQLSVKRV